MSASAVGMFATSALESLISNSTQSRTQSFSQAFQKLGQDLQSGNLSQAQADLANLDPNLAASQPAQTSSASSSSSPSLVSQAFNQLSTDLKAGNLAAAQSDYATLQQDLQQTAGHMGHHRFHRSGSGAGANSNYTQTQQAMGQLAEALQSGNLSAAQQAYTSVQADLAAMSNLGSSGMGLPGSSSSGTGLSVSA